MADSKYKLLNDVELYTADAVDEKLETYDDAIAQAEADAAEALAAAEAVYDVADEAKTTAESAVETAQEAEAEASSVQSLAIQALASATTAANKVTALTNVCAQVTNDITTLADNVDDLISSYAFVYTVIPDEEDVLVDMYHALIADTAVTWEHLCQINGSSGGSGGTWGTITGILANQTDLKSALDAKADTDELTAIDEMVQYLYNNKMDKSNPTGTGSLSLNRKANTIVGAYSTAEGYSTEASGSCSHAEGDSTEASGSCSHAEGDSTEASGDYSHAEGSDTVASGDYSHVEGFDTEASGRNSHAEGSNTIASGDYSHVEGILNVEDTNDQYANIVGGGTFGTPNVRKNISALDWNGNLHLKGKVYQNCNDDSSGGTPAPTTLYTHYVKVYNDTDSSTYVLIAITTMSDTPFDNSSLSTYIGHITTGIPVSGCVPQTETAVVSPGYAYAIYVHSTPKLTLRAFYYELFIDGQLDRTLSHIDFDLNSAHVHVEDSVV